MQREQSFGFVPAEVRVLLARKVFVFGIIFMIARGDFLKLLPFSTDEGPYSIQPIK
jgi:hypothetical protein